MVKERPIIFNTEMVKAILDGRKTQTRRVIKWGKGGIIDGGAEWPSKDNPDYVPYEIWKCPYGKIRDSLWVRETWYAQFYKLEEIDGPIYEYHEVTKENRTEDLCVGKWYKERFKTNIIKEFFFIEKWTPSIFMPRWASRIDLEITDIRVERVQDISESDAVAEGIGREHAHGKDIGWKNYLWHGHYGQYGRGNKQSDSWEHQYSTYDEPKGCFSSLWDSINVKRGYGWEVNPFVWCISFKKGVVNA